MAVIELPATTAFRAVKPMLVDTGYVLKSGGNGASVRIDRPGSHYKAEFMLPPMRPRDAMALRSRLAEARSAGIKVFWPLVDQDQGGFGAPLVNGTDSTGTVLKLKGMTAGAFLKEGAWLNVLDAAGVHYLHDVRTAVSVASDGTATLRVWPPLRTALANNAVVKIAKPMIEGNLLSEVEWDIPVNRIFTPPPLVIEEAR
jgi:hypothetical protein